MTFFQELYNMDMINCAFQSDSNPFIVGSYLGYIDSCENQMLLDAVVREALLDDNEIANLEEICIRAGVDPTSLTKSDLAYIEKKFMEENY